MFLSRRHSLPLAVLFGGVILVSACTEKLTGSAGCPSLCGSTALEYRDTVLYAVTFDSSIAGYPPLGSEGSLTLADFTANGEVLRTAGVARFDSVTRERAKASTDTSTAPTTFTVVDSARVDVNIESRTGADTLLVQDSVTINVYDVYVPAPDLDTGAVRALFDNRAPITSRTVPKDSVKGTVQIPLPDAFIQQKVLNDSTIRLGFTATSRANVLIHVLTSSGTPPTLHYIGRRDTVRTPVSVGPNTLGERTEIPGLTTYTVLRTVAPPPAGSLLGVGGLPGRRIFMRLDVPNAILDSTTLVRATLILNQLPHPGIQDTVPLTVTPNFVRADPSLTDVAKLALLVGSGASIGIPSFTSKPDSSGDVRIRILNLLRFWQTERRLQIATQRALVLQSAQEGRDPRMLVFESRLASDSSLRPRLELSYIPRAAIGLP